MRIRKVSAVVILAGMILGCDARSVVTEPTSDLKAGFTRHDGVAGIAAGGGKAQLPAGFTLLSFSFSAVGRTDGSATGEFRQRYESAGGTVEFTGRVTCVSFDPATNRAWIGGVVTRNTSTNPGALTPIHEVGDDVWFRVVDNGEGQSAPDRTTVLGFEGAAGVITSLEYCERQLWAANDANTWAVTDGNIQVMP